MKILSIMLGLLLAFTIVGCDEMENPFAPSEAVAADVIVVASDVTTTVPTAKVEEIEPVEVPVVEEETKPLVEVPAVEEETKPLVEDTKPAESKCGGDTGKKGGDKKSGKCGAGKCGGAK